MHVLVVVGIATLVVVSLSSHFYVQPSSTTRVVWYLAKYFRTSDTFGVHSLRPMNEYFIPCSVSPLVNF